MGHYGSSGDSDFHPEWKTDHVDRISHSIAVLVSFYTAKNSSSDSKDKTSMTHQRSWFRFCFKHQSSCLEVGRLDALYLDVIAMAVLPHFSVASQKVFGLLNLVMMAFQDHEDKDVLLSKTLVKC